MAGAPPCRFINDPLILVTLAVEPTLTTPPAICANAPPVKLSAPKADTFTAPIPATLTRPSALTEVAKTELVDSVPMLLILILGITPRALPALSSFGNVNDGIAVKLICGLHILIELSLWKFIAPLVLRLNPAAPNTLIDPSALNSNHC